MPKKRSTIRAAAIVASGTLLSRVLGLARVIAMAYFFGEGIAMDAFFIAFLVPNLFRKLFGEGALSAAVIPVLTNVRESGREPEARVLINSVSTQLFFLLTVLTLLGLAAMWLVPVDFFGEQSEKWIVARTYFTWLCPLVLFLCLTGLHAGVLNTYGKFAVPAILPALHNLVWITAILIPALTPWGGETIGSQIMAMCVGLTLGGVLQFVIQLIALARAGVKVLPSFEWGLPSARDIRRAVAPTILALAVFQINTLIDLLLAELLVPGHGAVSAYSYANTVFQFPLGIVSIALSTAIFPMLARYAARGEPDKVTGGLLNGIRLLAFVVFPAAGGLLALNHEIVVVLLSRGEFDPSAVSRTAKVLLFFSLALPFVSSLQLVTKVFYALRDTKTPTKIGLFSVAINLGLNIVLVQTPLQEAGLALSTCISSGLNLLILSIILRKRLHGTILESRRLRTAEAVSDRLAQPLSASGIRAFRVSLARSFGSALLMAMTVVFLLRLLPASETGDLRTIGIVTLAVVTGAAVYGVLQLTFKAPELKELRPAS